MSAGAWFKAATCQKPTPKREREITDELIERQSKRITELERENAELRKALQRASGVLSELNFSDWIPKSDWPSIDIRQRINAAHVIVGAVLYKETP